MGSFLPFPLDPAACTPHSACLQKQSKAHMTLCGKELLKKILIIIFNLEKACCSPDPSILGDADVDSGISWYLR